MTSTAPYKTLKRGALARALGCNLETIRFYETIGIMPDPARSASGHRLYEKDAQDRLRFILRCRRLGFSIEDIRGLLSMVDSENYTCKDVYVLTKEYLDSVAQKIADLKKLQRTLKGILTTCGQGDDMDCPIIEALYEG